MLRSIIAAQRIRHAPIRHVVGPAQRERLDIPRRHCRVLVPLVRDKVCASSLFLTHGRRCCSASLLLGGLAARLFATSSDPRSERDWTLEDVSAARFATKSVHASSS